MAEATLANTRITIRCGECRKESMKLLRELISKETAICNRCGALIKLKEWRPLIAEALERIKKSKSTPP
jgi:peptide subunit release factor 1 (eRF1)